MGGYYEEVGRVVGRRISELRKEIGISQEEMGYRAGLHRTAAGELERGIRVPRIDTLLKVAAALEVSIGELVGGLAWHPPERAAGAFTVEPPPEERAGGGSR
jgi:transcriptional regulator with XRE-family HTH domain